jgi:pyruvate,water dikinase
MLGTRWIVDRVPTERFPNYTRGNAGDVLADPVSPLGWTFGFESGVVPGCRDGFVLLGVFDTEEYDAQRPESFGLFGGYFYNSLTQARLFGVRSGAGWQAIDNAYFDDPSACPPYIERDWHDSPRHSEALAKKMGWIMSTPSVPDVERQKIDAKAIRDSRPDLGTQTITQLLGRARSIQRHISAMFAQHAIVTLGASVGPGVIAGVTAEIDPSVVTRLLSGIGDVDSSLIARSIWTMSRLVQRSTALTALFDLGLDGLGGHLASAEGADADVLRTAIETFTYEHGSRGPNEWDIMSPSYETRPAILLSAIDRLRRQSDDADPELGIARGSAERDRLMAELEAKLAGNDEALGMLHAGLGSAKVFMVARERCKTNSIRALHEIRMSFEEIGRRMAAAGHLADRSHVYMLTEDELDAFAADPASFTATLAERAADYRELFDLEPPYIVDVEAPPLSEWTRRSNAAGAAVAVGDVLSGVAGSPGVVTGTARVLLSIDDPIELEPGDILIAPQTDPSWTPLFLAVSGVVVNIGAIGTHAVIVSRELGIPCVPSVADATRRIPTGATITINGHEGTVTIDALPA